MDVRCFTAVRSEELELETVFQLQIQYRVKPCLLSWMIGKISPISFLTWHTQTPSLPPTTVLPLHFYTGRHNCYQIWGVSFFFFWSEPFISGFQSNIFWKHEYVQFHFTKQLFPFIFSEYWYVLQWGRKQTYAYT